MRILAAALLAVALASGARAEVEVGGILLREGPLDRVSVQREDWAWSSGAEKMPAVSVTLQSGRFRYTIRHDQKYGRGQLGLSEPNASGWYQAGMLDVLVDGKRIDLLPECHETITTGEGARGWARFAWETDAAKVAMTCSLAAGQDRLLLTLELEPKLPPKSLALRLMSYAGGFDRQPQHLVKTPSREVTAAGPMTLSLPAENVLFLADRRLDAASEPLADGPAGLAFDPDVITAATIHPGGYGIPIELTCRPDARRVVLALWEFPQTPNADAAARLFAPATLEAVRAQLRAPEGRP